MSDPVHSIRVDTPTPAGGSAAVGSVIHDLGYRRYDGPRTGASEARRALFWQGFRALFGLGRPAKSKVIPVFVLAVTMMPSLASVVASGASNGQVPVLYASLVAGQTLLFVLFMAAQGPELMSRDQQHRVLPLMFTRTVTRNQYAFVRWLSVFCAVLCVALAPLLLLWIGQLGVAKDPSLAFESVGPKIGPVFLLATTMAWVIGSVGAFLSSLSPRRAYATAAVIGTFLVLIAVGSAIRDLAGGSYYLAAYIDQIEGMRTVAFILFGETTRGLETHTPPPVWTFLLTQYLIGAAGIAGLFWRMRKVDV